MNDLIPYLAWNEPSPLTLIAKPRISFVTLHLDPEFAARVKRTYQVDPELLVRIIRSFHDDRPMAELAKSTGLSHDVLNRIYSLKWRQAIIATPPAPTPSSSETLPMLASFSQAKESISDELVDRIKALTALRIRSADICAWLGITHQQMREARAHPRISESADAGSVD